MADLRAAWHRPRLRILVVLWLLVVVAWLARASPSDELDSLEQIMREQGLTAASLAYGRIGGEPTLRAIGTERERVFPYYSLSKPITAAAVMAQVERETVSLSDEMSGATVRQLLQHTGGWDREIAGDPVTQRQSREPCTELGPPPRQFAPGARFAYSNIGYCLLGNTIAETTGLSYREAVHRDLPETRAMALDPWLGPAGGWSGTAEAFYHFASRPLPDGTAGDPVQRVDDLPYGLGWSVGADGLLTHFGALFRHFAVVVRKDELVAVALFEGRPPEDLVAAKALRPVLLELARTERLPR